MNLNRGVARPSPAPTGGGTRSNVTSGQTARDAGVARATASGLFGPLTRADSNDDTASSKPKTKKPGTADEGLSDDDNEVAKAYDDEVAKAKGDVDKIDGDSPDTKPGQDDDMVKKAAGDGGDFKPLKGDAKNPWDANSDKGNTSADNDTGAPNTPSGL